MKQHLNETHKSEVFIMFHNLSTFFTHKVTSPCPDDSIRITPFQSSYKIGAMQITGSLPGYYIISHLISKLLFSNQPFTVFNAE